MFVRTKSTPNSPRRSVQIVQSRRKGNEISQAIIRHVGIALNDAEEKELIRLAEIIKIRMEEERTGQLSLFSPEEIVGTAPGKKRRGPKLQKKNRRDPSEVTLVDVVEEQRVIEGIGEVFGRLYHELGFSKIISGTYAGTLETLVLARVANPASKRRTAALLEKDYGLRVPLDKIYRMMDDVYANRERLQDRVRGATLRLFFEKIDVIFFDVTTLYFESFTEDELKAFGYSKDQKFHMVQVVLALATTQEGLPIGYRLFHGATAEVKTLIACLQDWRKKIDIGHVILVADRAMMSEDNLTALEKNGFEYIIGASLKKQPRELQKIILDEEGYRAGASEKEFFWTNEFPLESGRRLIAAYNSERAKKDMSDRNRLIEKLIKRLGNAKKGKTQRLISNRGYLKYIQVDGASQVGIDDAKVENDAKWDGLFGIVTNAKEDRLSLISRYRRLFTIEEAFRITKHDLAMRPIFHFKPQRIEAHIAICYLAYALTRHAQHRIRLRQRAMSFQTIRDELLSVQSSILRDKKTGGLYRLPSPMTQKSTAIYKAFDLKRVLSVTPI